jgi:hypothetical protein
MFDKYTRARIAPIGVKATVYPNPSDYGQMISYQNETRDKLALIEYRGKKFFLEPGDTTLVKVNDTDLSFRRDSIPFVTLINRGNPDA